MAGLAGAGEANTADLAETAGLLLAREQLTLAVLHDLGSPLSSILLYCDLLLGQEQADFSTERVSRIRDAAEKCQRLVGQLASVLADTSAETNALAVPDWVEAAIELARPRLAVRGQIVEPSLDPGLPMIYADRAGLTLILVTLLHVAAQVADQSDNSRALAVRAEALRGEPPLIRLKVSWAGHPLNSDTLARLNDPPAGQGAPAAQFLEWLGARAVAARLGARVWAENGNEPGGGAAIGLEAPARMTA